MVPTFLAHSKDKHHFHFLPPPNPATSFLSRLLEHFSFQAFSVLPDQDGDVSQRLLGLLQRIVVMASVLLPVHHKQATAGNNNFSTAFRTACAARWSQSKWTGTFLYVAGYWFWGVGEDKAKG